MISLKLQQQPRRKVKIEWSSNFAYAIGLITSDGCIAKRRGRISFKCAEEELVNKFKLALSVDNKTGLVRGWDKRKDNFQVNFSDVIFYEFLNKIGLSPAKSKIIKSVIVPNDFFADFLRGLFDGDGTFYTFWDRRWPSSFCYQLSFASASLDFINWLKSSLNRLYGVKGVICRGDGVFNLRYVKGDSRRLFEIMYYKEGLLFLNRKHNKIKTALSYDRVLKAGRGSSLVELSPDLFGPLRSNSEMKTG